MEKTRIVRKTVAALAATVCGAAADGMPPLLRDRLDAAHHHLLESRREAFAELSDPFGVPRVARRVVEEPVDRFKPAMSWRRNIIATVFWVGEEPSEDRPVSRATSAWDLNRELSFGGYDHPGMRNGHTPAGFVPLQNPFYIALPYNDLGEDGRHRPEASEVIPWFWRAYRGDHVSVCKGRWLAIHRNGRVCYAQWEDAGPSGADHFEYVFGTQRPGMNRNKGAGIEVSPAVRDFLALRSGETVEWRFVEEYEVPPGPWKSWGISHDPRGLGR